MTARSSQLEAMYAAATVLDADDRPRPFHSGVTLDQAHALTALVAAERPRATLEIGFAFGASALAILTGLATSGHDHAPHRVIDPYQHSNWAGAGLAVVRRDGFDVDLIEQPSHVALADLDRAGVRVDFALVDGGHTHEVVVVDAMLTDAILEVGGIVVFHDYSMPAVRRGVRHLLDSGRYERVRHAEIPVPFATRARRPLQRLRARRGTPAEIESALVRTDMPVLRKRADAVSDA